MNVPDAAFQVLHIAHERVAVDANQRVHAQRLDAQGKAQLAARLQIGVGPEYNEVGIAKLFKGEKFLRERLVLLNVDLAGSAARTGNAQQSENSREPGGAELVASECLQQIEDQIRPAPPESGEQFRQAGMYAQNGNLMAFASQACRDLSDYFIALAGAFTLEMGQNRDSHWRAPRTWSRATGIRGANRMPMAGRNGIAVASKDT